MIEGLPPGPIANPGRASLEATANPARTRDLFFVADGTGGHSFTETYDQHQKGVAKLRAMEKQQQNDTAEADDQPPVAAVPSPAAGAPAAAAPAKPAAPKAAPKASAPKASAPASIIANEPAADGAASRKRTAKRAPASAPAEPEPEEKTQ